MNGSRKVKILPVVCQALSFCDLSREGLVRLIAKVLNELPSDANRFRGIRVGGLKEAFRYRVVIKDDERTFMFTFAVNDQQDPERYIVQGVTPNSRPNR